MRRCILRLWVPDVNGWHLARTERRRTMVLAERRATALLEPWSEDVTRSGRRPRLAYVEIERKGVDRNLIEAEARLVPSVGELGWTP